MRRITSLFAVLILSACSSGGGGGNPDGGGSGGGGGGSSWLVATHGFLARTTDGVNFESRPSPTSADLFSLVCSSHTFGWAVGAAGTIIATANSGDWWVDQSGATQEDLHAVAFSDPQNGIAVGNSGTVLRTVNGGGTWAPVLLGSPANRWAINSAAISADATQAWISGDYGLIMRSVDGGQTFVRATTPTQATLRAVRFADDKLHGFAVGDGGAVFGSSDGGATWTALASAPGDLHGLAVSGDGARIFAVGAAGLIWRSTDAGATFSAVSVAVPGALLSVGFSEDNPSTGWVAGEGGAVLVTFNGGAQFQPAVINTSETINSIEDL